MSHFPKDGYAAPRASVDDGVREPRSWRNAAIAFVAGLAGEFAFMLYLASTLKESPQEMFRETMWHEWILIVLAAIPVALAATWLRRLRWYWLVPIAAMLTVGVLLLTVLLFAVATGQF